MSKKRTIASSALAKPTPASEPCIVRFVEDNEPYEDPPNPTDQQLRQFKRLGMSAIDFRSKAGDAKKQSRARLKK